MFVILLFVYILSFFVLLFVSISSFCFVFDYFFVFLVYYIIFTYYIIAFTLSNDNGSNRQSFYVPKTLRNHHKSLERTTIVYLHMYLDIRKPSCISRTYRASYALEHNGTILNLSNVKQLSSFLCTLPHIYILKKKL